MTVFDKLEKLHGFIKSFLPIKDPVLIFSLVLLIILMAPVIFNRFKIPGIISMILSGVLIGSNGFNILERDQGIILFGTVGLLYIMFLAGLEVDMIDFKKNKNKSFVFGFLTFAIPMMLGTATTYYILDFSLTSSILLASMFASHTLLAYPIASRLGIAKNRAVNVTVGGTIITDVAALLVLAIITSSVKGELNDEFWIRLGISLVIFAFIVLWGFPRIARWFFKNFESEGVSQYIFVLSMVFMAAFLSEVAGVEPIIGAFLAGLSLNRLIPHSSPLMNRIEFVGNALFIPFFLISVGMLVDVKVLFKGTEALLVAVSMIVVATTGKFLAAWFTQKIFKFSSIEKDLIFGLSNAQAAATLAAVLVGYKLDLLNENVLNGTIMMILATCIISSFVVEKAARKQAIIENEKSPQLGDVPDRILVPIANPNNIEQLIDFAIMIKSPSSIEPIYPLVVVKDNEETEEKLMISQKVLERAKKHASGSDHEVSVLTRVDLNISSGILRAIRDLMITEVVVGWNPKLESKSLLFSSTLDNLIRKCGKMILISKFVQPVNTLKRIVVAVPPRAEYEKGFGRWVNTLRYLAKQSGTNLSFFASSNAIRRLQDILKEGKISIKSYFYEFDDWEDFLILSRELKPDDLFVVVKARPATVSYISVMDNIPRQLAKHFKDISFVILYPGQDLGEFKDSIQQEPLETSLIQENIERFSKVGKSFSKIFK